MMSLFSELLSTFFRCLSCFDKSPAGIITFTFTLVLEVPLFTSVPTEKSSLVESKGVKTPDFKAGD